MHHGFSRWAKAIIIMFHFVAVFKIKKCVAYDWLTIRPSESTVLNNEAVIIIHVYFGQHSPLKKKKKKKHTGKKTVLTTKGIPKRETYGD